jgi:centromere protein I
LEYLPLQPYDNLRSEYFSLLEKAIFDDSVQFKIILLRYYSSLIRHWGSLIRAQDANPSASDSMGMLAQVIEHAELLSLTILETPSTTPTKEDTEFPTKYLSVLQFYASLGHLYTHAPTRADIRLTIPRPQTIYILAFTPTLTHISILSSILATYKSSFEGSLTSTFLHNPSAPEPLYPTKTVGQFNGYIMDVCNLIWRNRGLNTDDPNALGCLVPLQVVNSLNGYIRQLNRVEEANHDEDSGREAFQYHLHSMFSLSHHAALCGFAAACFRDFENETLGSEGGDSGTVRLSKPVTRNALIALEKQGGVKSSWQEYRLRMLEWLDDRGSEGIGNLMRTTMKALRKEG